MSNAPRRSNEPRRAHLRSRLLIMVVGTLIIAACAIAPWFKGGYDLPVDPAEVAPVRTVPDPYRALGRIAIAAIAPEADHKDLVLGRPEGPGGRELTPFACHPEGRGAFETGTGKAIALKAAGPFIVAAQTR